MTYSPRLLDALKLMLELHGAQTRKGSEIPYVTHLFAVAALVGEHGGSEDQVIAALLHDAVEDQGGLEVLDRIRSSFGAAVAELVWAASDAHEQPKPPWRERKEHHIAATAAASPDAKLILAADKLHNAQSMRRDLRVLGPELWARFNGGREGTLWYLRGMHGALAAGWEHAILGELDEVVRALEDAAG